MSAAAAIVSAPPVLLPFQQRWLADKSPVKVGEKSRQVGWTWSTGAEAVLVAGARKGMDVWYSGYDLELAREFIVDCAEWTTKFGMAAREFTGGGTLGDARIGEVLIEDDDSAILAFRISYASGFRISALTSTPRKFRGKGGYAIIDEAAYHSDLDALLKAAAAFLMWGGRLAIMSTHNGVDNPFNRLIENIRGGRLNYSLHRTTLDDALAEGLYQRICLMQRIIWTPEGERIWRDELFQRYGEGSEEELLCVPAKQGKKYLSGTLVEACMYTAPIVRRAFDDEWAQLPEQERVRDVKQWCEDVIKPLLDAIPKTARTFLGEDFGRTSDLSVFVPCVLEQNLVRRVPFMVELRNCPHNAQWQVLEYILDRLPSLRKVHMDAGGNGSHLAEVTWQKYGSDVVERVHIDQDWYATQLPIFKAGCEDKLLLCPRDLDVRNDLLSFELINAVPRLPSTRTTGRTGPRHGDSGIALVMMYAASRDDSAADWLATYGKKRGS